MKTMWAGVLSLAVLASCSQEELVTTNENNGNGEEQTWCTDVKLILPSVAGTGRVATRGVGDTQDDDFADGEEYEYDVNPSECFFVFLDEQRRRIGQASGNQIDWGNQDGNNTDNVTRIGTVRLKSTIKPAYLICFLNAPSKLRSELNQMDLTRLKSAQTLNEMEGDKETIKNYFARTTSGNRGFFMTNSSYINGYGNRVQEVDIQANVYEAESSSSSSSSSSPALIYVERAVAKTTLSITAEGKQEREGRTWYKLTTTNITPTNHDEEVQFGVCFLTWGLNATNKSFTPLKNIPENGNAWNFSQYSWYSSNQYRTYWEQDGNYSSGQGEFPTNSSFNGTSLDIGNQVLNYYNLKQCTNTAFDGKSAEYCFANTMEGNFHKTYSAVTHVLVKAQYTDSEGNLATGPIFQIGKQIYTESAMKKAVISLAKDYVTEDLLENEIKFVYQGQDGPYDDYEERNDVRVTVSLIGNGVEKLKKDEGLNPNNINGILFGEQTLWVFREGKCYYSIPIKHFANLKKETTGYYGVVRNHWYQINISAISGFGHPTSPDKPIIPEPIEDDEWMLSCEINVLAWGKVEQNATVGGNEDWQ